MIHVEVVGADRVAAELGNIGLRAAYRATRVVAKYGMLYQTRVRAHASGRPGPRAITGHYRRSISFELVMTAGGPVAVVGSNAPQARRLEYGFHDTDSLGRVFQQPPYPHFDPPLERTVAEMQVELAEMILRGDIPLTGASNIGGFT